jgi:hypothetical protein
MTLMESPLNRAATGDCPYHLGHVSIWKWYKHLLPEKLVNKSLKHNTNKVFGIGKAALLCLG